MGNKMHINCLRDKSMKHYLFSVDIEGADSTALGALITNISFHGNHVIVQYICDEFDSIFKTFSSKSNFDVNYLDKTGHVIEKWKVYTNNIGGGGYVDGNVQYIKKLPPMCDHSKSDYISRTICIDVIRYEQMKLA